MTLDDLLALLPDEPDGNISAADMRVIVEELFKTAHTVVTRLAFEYSTDTTPPTGKITVPNWGLTATGLILSEMTSDGEPVPFGMLNTETMPADFVLGAAGSALMRGQITAIPIDAGAYRTAAITVSEALTEPAANAPLTFLVAGQWYI